MQHRFKSSPVVHWVLHLPATREVAGSSPAVAHLTAKSPRRSSPDQGVGPLHSVESSRASCNSRCRKAGSRPDMATSPCLAPKTKMIVADWPKLKKKKKKKSNTALHVKGEVKAKIKISPVVVFRVLSRMVLVRGS